MGIWCQVFQSDITFETEIRIWSRVGVESEVKANKVKKELILA